MLSEWTNKVRPLYSSVDLGYEEEWLYASRHPLLRTDETYRRISQLRQDGLEEARKRGAHYLLVINYIVVACCNGVRSPVVHNMLYCS